MVFSLLKIFVWPILWLFIRKVEGIDNLPKGRFIIAANHASFIDPVLILLLVAIKRNRRVRFLATKGAKFQTFLWKRWFNYAGAIRVNGSLDKAIKAAKKDCIGIFPEGSRTYNGKVQPVKHSGLGVLALKTNLPVVPIGTNTFWFWNRSQKCPSFKRCINVCIGKPMKFKLKPTKRNTKKVVDNVMKEVKKLARAANA
jgi:1-acyl-sn-glycerol-3-phosphate acyltransferase